MATGKIKTYGYDVGDSGTFYFRSVGRITSNGQNIYTTLMVDKPILAPACTVTLSGSPNFYRLRGEDTISYSSGAVTIVRIANNMIMVYIPITPQTTSGYTYYVEAIANVTFTAS